MALGMIAGLSLAMMAASAPVTHDLAIDHRGAAVRATYHGEVEVEHKQVGAISAPGRATVRRCDWTGAVRVSRHVSGPGGHAPVVGHVAHDRLMSGSRAGDCTAVRTGIARDVAAQHAKVRAHVAAVAERDRARLHRELTMVNRLASD